MAAEEYRVIIRFTAGNGKEAKSKSDAAVKTLGAGAKLDRLTVRRETWGSMPDEKE